MSARKLLLWSALGVAERGLCSWKANIEVGSEKRKQREVGEAEMWPGNLSLKQIEKEITPLSHHHQRPTTQDPRRVLLKSSTYRHSGALFSHRPWEPESQRGKKKSCVEEVRFFIHLEKNCNYLGKMALVGSCSRSWFWAEGSLHLGDSSSCRWTCWLLHFQTLSSPSHLSRLTLFGGKPQQPNGEEKLQWRNFCFTSLFAFSFKTFSYWSFNLYF